MFTLEGHEVSFNHDRNVEGHVIGKYSGKLLPYKGMTLCLLDGEVVGVAHCSILDTFNYNKGRKAALKHALEDMGFPKEIRAEFWNEYISVRGGVP